MENYFGGRNEKGEYHGRGRLKIDDEDEDVILEFQGRFKNGKK